MSFWEMAYRRGWADLEVLKKAVKLGEVTEEAFETIVHKKQADAPAA